MVYYGLPLLRRAVELVKEAKGTVKAPHIKEVVQVMQNTPTAAYLRDLSFHERLMLTSLVKCMKRDGVNEISWGDVRRSNVLDCVMLTAQFRFNTST